MEFKTYVNGETGEIVLSSIDTAPEGYELVEAERPSPDHVWEDGEWVLSQEAKKRIAKEVMDADLAQGAVWNGITFQCYADDVDKFTKGLDFAERSGIAAINTRDMYNAMHVVTIADMTEIALLIGSRYYNALQTYWSSI